MVERSTSTAEAQVRERLESWTRAVRARDLEGVLAHHAADIVMFDVPPPEQWSGLARYRESWELFFRHFPSSGGSFDIEQMQIVADGDLACAFGLLRCGPSHDTFPVRLTVILRRQEGGWTFVHEHHSVPAPDVDTQ
ncbi:MAG TPA: nuclear transport factor 2 family protein [Steroidobacteraceae bacterium]|nr:nuclear transport factor 2 family protein [Steroidobacteraceae bacterium]